MKFGILSELFRTVPDLGTCRFFFRGDRALDAVTVKIGRMGSFDNWDCEKTNSELFCMSFSYLVNLTRGFNPEHLCDSKNDGFYFWPMSNHKELIFLWLTLAKFFDPKHFVVEKSVRKSIISLRPNRQ